jgi:hypothetical protein
MRANSRFIFWNAAAGLICACALQSAVAAAADEETPDAAEARAQAYWRADIGEIAVPEDGCFHASYPNLFWQRVACGTGKPRAHLAHPNPEAGSPAVVGNGKDYVASVKGLLSAAHGSFPIAKGITSEKSVGVPIFGDGGILGPNEYSLQLNTNFTGTTKACAGHSGCVVWQQFIYATDLIGEGVAAVFMQYWLIDWGSAPCPTDFFSDGEGDCFANSNFTAVPDLKPKVLDAETLTGSATSGGSDTVKFTHGSDSYAVSGKDTVLDIATVWNQAEFNVVGDAGGSEAVFNKGVSITVKVAVTDGTTSAPSCLSNDGTTGETNNLNLGKCLVVGGATPEIEFVESN